MLGRFGTLMHGIFAEKFVQFFHLIVWWIVETVLHSPLYSSMFPSIKIPSNSPDGFLVNSSLPYSNTYRSTLLLGIVLPRAVSSHYNL